jgi:hypothetical protein
VRDGTVVHHAFDGRDLIEAAEAEWERMMGEVASPGVRGVFFV